jgi:L-amino acid N-acyltransferase YncA
VGGDVHHPSPARIRLQEAQILNIPEPFMAKPSITIRDATIEDLPHIYFAWQKGVQEALTIHLDPVLQEQESRYRARFRSHFDEIDNTFRIWVAEHEGRIIGWQYLLPFHNNPVIRHLSGEVGTYVSPDHRRLGVGTALLKHAIEHSRNTALQYIVGYIAEENDAVTSVASRVGFKKFGEFPAPLKAPKHSALYIYIHIVPENQ